MVELKKKITECTKSSQQLIGFNSYDYKPLCNHGNDY